MAGLPPQDANAIARASGLSERYVREWLSAMAVGGIVTYDASSGTFQLPAEHAASLTRAAGAENFACFAQYVALLGEVEEQIVAAFRHGGGVPYSAYPRFQQVMAEDSRQVLDATLLTRTLPLIPGLPDRLREGIDVLDLGCGRGYAANLMAGEYPNSRFTGIDISVEGIATARVEADRLGRRNARFEVVDAAQFSANASYDFITTFDAIHDQAHPRKVLAAIRRALKPGGVYLMVDICASSHLGDNLEHPLAPFLYTASTMHCMTVSLAEGGEGLGTMWGEQKARELLAEAGFGDVEIRHVEGDIANSFYIARS
jgi:SAM-dependent methyltransferase